MPLIEELPVTQPPRATAGWAYVPDTGPIAAQQPGTRDRKRATARAPSHLTSTAKQQKAIQQRLDSLNKENYRDGVTVPVPPRKEKAGRKMTSNVRRILTYQRGFAHYLADEEANNPNGVHYQLPILPPTAGISSVKETSVSGNRRRNTVTRHAANEASEPSTPTSDATSLAKGKRRGRPSSSHKQAHGDSNSATAGRPGAQVKTEEEQDPEHDTSMTDVTASAQAQPSPSLPAQQVSAPTPYPPEWDTDPLLVSTTSEVPRMPSERMMQLLISEPPLTYNAARATPLEPDKQVPPRRFCGVCGYWGKVKCRKCGEFTCGILECWRAHEGVCPMANAY